MTLDEQKTQEANISNEVYKAVIKIFESLECKKQIYGNGHHAAQHCCAFAVEELHKRWIDKRE